MKKCKYLFISCFVIMGLLVGFYIQNVDAYQASQNQDAVLIQTSNFIAQTSSVCPMGHKNCNETHTQVCALGHVNCQINHDYSHNYQTSEKHHQKETHHSNHAQHH